MESFRQTPWSSVSEAAPNNKDDNPRSFWKGKEGTTNSETGAESTRPPMLDFQANLPNLGSSGLTRHPPEDYVRGSPTSPPKSARRFSWPRPGGRIGPGLGVFNRDAKPRESKEGWDSIESEQPPEVHHTVDDQAIHTYSLFHRSGRTESRESLGASVRGRADSSELRRSSMPSLQMSSSLWSFQPDSTKPSFTPEVEDPSKGKLRVQKLRQEIKKLIGVQAEYYSFDAVTENDSQSDVMDILKYEGCAMCLRRDFPAPKEGSVDEPVIVLLTCKLYSCRHMAHLPCLVTSANNAGPPAPALLNFHGSNAFRLVVLPPKTPPIPFPLPRDAPGNLRYCALELEINHILSNVQVLQISWGHTISTLLNTRTRREYLLITLSPTSTPSIAPATPAGHDSEPNTPSAPTSASSASASSSSTAASASVTVSADGGRKDVIDADADARGAGAFPSFAIGRGQMTFKCTDQSSMHTWVHALAYDLSPLHEHDHDREKRTTTCKLVAVDPTSRNVLTIGVRRVEERGSEENLYSISYLKYEFSEVVPQSSSVPPLARGGLNSPPLSPPPIASPANPPRVFLPSAAPSPMTSMAAPAVPPSPAVFAAHTIEPPSPTPAWYTPPQSPGLMAWARPHGNLDPSQAYLYSQVVIGEPSGVPAVPTIMEHPPLQPPRPIHIRQQYQDTRGHPREQPGRFVPGRQPFNPGGVFPRNPEEDWSPGYANPGMGGGGGMGRDKGPRDYQNQHRNRSRERGKMPQQRGRPRSRDRPTQDFREFGQMQAEGREDREEKRHTAATPSGSKLSANGNVGDASGPTSRDQSVSPPRGSRDSSGSNSPVYPPQPSSNPPFYLPSQVLNLPSLGPPLAPAEFSDRNGVSTTSPPPAPPAINLTREQVIGNVVRLAKSHSGSRFLQQKLEEGDRDFFAVFYEEMKDHVPELMVDNFGHFAIEKLIVQANEEQTLTLLQKLAPHIVQVACQKHGSFSVQALVDSIRTPAQIYVLVEALTKDIVKVITHVSGHFVVLRLLQRFPYDFTKFIDDAITANCLQIGTDHHGLRVVKAVLALRRPSELTRLFKTIAKLTMKLVENQFGNYVIQSLLDVAPPNVRTNVKVKMEGKYMRLSQQKFSSNVVEKCLKQSSAHWRGIIIKELMQQPQVSDLLRDRYGNYVLQTALSVASPQQVQEISEAINQHLPSLRENVRGKWKKMLKKAAQRVV